MNNNFFKRIFTLLAFAVVGATMGYFAGGLDWSPDIKILKKQPANVSEAVSINIDPTRFYRVTDVVDGDTFKVMIDDKEVTVRMLGINTPEVLDPRKPVECYGPEASDKTKSLLAGGEVRLALNPSREETDKYERVLAYAYRLDGLFVNEYLVKEGFAREYTVGKAYQYQSEFKSAEKTAKENSLGLWGKCAF